MAREIPPGVNLGTAVLVDQFKHGDVPDEQSKEFYAALGKAICAWQQVESALGEVFVLASASQFPRLPAMIFFSQRSFDEQLNMLEIAVLNLPLNNEPIAEWYSIRKRAKKLYGKRNILAHSPVEMRTSGDPPVTRIHLAKNHDVRNAAMRRIALSQDPENGIKPRDETEQKSRDTKAESETLYDSTKIEEFSQSFFELGSRIRFFCASLNASSARR